MKTRLAILIYLVSIATLSAQKIYIFSPNGGEEWRKGSNQTISWNNSETTSGTFKITLWRNGSNLGVIATNLPASQNTFDWTVGKLQGAPDAPLGSGYTVKIRVQGKPISDTSNAPFTIRDRPLAARITKGNRHGDPVSIRPPNTGVLNATPANRIPADPCKTNQDVDARLFIKDATFMFDPVSRHMNFSLKIKNNSTRCLKSLEVIFDAVTLNSPFAYHHIDSTMINDPILPGEWTLKGNTERAFPGGFTLAERFLNPDTYTGVCKGKPGRSCIRIRVTVKPHDPPAGPEDKASFIVDLGDYSELYD